MVTRTTRLRAPGARIGNSPSTKLLGRGSPARLICRGIILVLISGLAAATLVRLAPGFAMDEQALDARLSAQSLEALERQHAGEQNPVAFYAHYLGRLIRGDAGRSAVFGQPVRQLICERASATVRAVTVGLVLGWAGAVLLALGVALSGRAFALLAGLAVSGSLISIPSAVLATICLLLQLSPAIAIAAVVFPRVFPHAHEQLRSGLAAPHVVMARARGVSRGRLLLWHVVPTVSGPVLALGGVSVSLAFGAAIPVEALADSPGIGQLAWRAALARDLPVLVGITLLLTAITIAGNVLADIIFVRIGYHAV